MTKAHSESGDNGGRCESCDDPATVHQPQQTYPVMLGGGLGQGTMWLCPKCFLKRQERDAKTKHDGEGVGAPVSAKTEPQQVMGLPLQRQQTEQQIRELLALAKKELRLCAPTCSDNELVVRAREIVHLIEVLSVFPKP